MGLLDKLKQAAGVQASLRVIEPNASTDIDFEWLRGRFSSMVVGEGRGVPTCASLRGQRLPQF
jgi:hypothetical protein